MARYFVTWEMDIEADSPEDAALEALRIHRNPESVATVFKVTEWSKKPVWVDINMDDNGNLVPSVYQFPER